LARYLPAAKTRKEAALPLVYPLVFAAFLFAAGVYGVLARRNAVMVLMSVELMLNAVNINLVAFSAFLRDTIATGQVFALFVIAVAAAEVGVGLAIVLTIYRNRATIDLESASLMKG
jgi:NADH-quinone oxidoreductase subunit K